MILRYSLTTVFVALLSSPVLALNENDFTVRALLKPVREATISSELPAKIASITRRSGDAFEAGDLLLRFDCSSYRAGFDEAVADLGIASTHLESKERLKKLNSAGALEVRLARLEVQRMQARLDSAKVMSDRCEIYAPFYGRVVDIPVNEHESVEAGEPLMLLQEDSTLEVSLVLPSSWLSWLNTGTELDLQVDETGKDYRGRVVRLGARVDAVSQSIRVTGELTAKHKELVAGMSGTVRFNRVKNTE